MACFECVATGSAGHGTVDLQRTSEFQAALLGMAGHNLRQPLQIIEGTYKLLRTRACSRSEQAWLDRGERAIDRLTGQLDHLLDAFHLHQHSKTLEMSSVAVEPLLDRLCEENKDAARQRGIDVRVCCTKAHVVSNPVLLAGILRNLLTNAIKYTAPGGSILIGCRRRGCDVRIDVIDTGIGIAAERLPSIFDAFERLDSVRSNGLGIGLFIVRRAVELLGHRLEVRSAVSRGSRFSIVMTTPQRRGPDDEHGVEKRRSGPET